MKFEPKRESIKNSGISSTIQQFYAILLFVIFSDIFSITSVHCFATCPSAQLINSLVTQQTDIESNTCECTVIQEGGWEITCYSEPSRSDITDDYHIVPYAFFIRYEFGHQVRITCDSGSPAFRPAIFQGLYSSPTFIQILYIFGEMTTKLSKFNEKV